MKGSHRSFKYMPWDWRRQKRVKDIFQSTIFNYNVYFVLKSRLYNILHDIDPQLSFNTTNCKLKILRFSR